MWSWWETCARPAAVLVQAALIARQGRNYVPATPTPIGLVFVNLKVLPACITSVSRFYLPTHHKQSVGNFPTLEFLAMKQLKSAHLNATILVRPAAVLVQAALIARQGRNYVPATPTPIGLVFVNLKVLPACITSVSRFYLPTHHKQSVGNFPTLEFLAMKQLKSAHLNANAHATLQPAPIPRDATLTV